MSTARTVVLGSWLSLPRVVVPIAASFALVLLLGAAAAWAVRNTEGALATVQTDLSATRGAIAAHATTMRAQGQHGVSLRTDSARCRR